MPTLDWIGKKAVVNHHREVPYRLVHCDGDLSTGDPDAGNLLVQGDNLEALKALLPYYAGKVKCIYIDPPYNTGNEGWVYNDNVNSAEIKAWLGNVVGDATEDLSRHDKWLCMMYPRLRLLREFLREDGVIFASIDDNANHFLKMLMEEIFGTDCFVAEVAWRHSDNSSNNVTQFSQDHNTILIYGKMRNWCPNFLNDPEKRKHFKNPDDDPRGPWFDGNPVNNPALRPTLQYNLEGPNGNVIKHPPNGWRWSKETVQQKLAIGELRFSRDGKRLVRRTYLSEMEGLPPSTLWTEVKQTGHTRSAKYDLKAIFGDGYSTDFFATPKPKQVVQRVLELSTDENDLVMDSFAGSGTTGHAVLDLNKQDGGNRKFILVEMDEQIAPDIAAERLKRVINGYDKGGDPEKPVDGLGGGFRYCRLGVPLFNEFGDIDGGVTFLDLAAHVFFAECGAPIPAKATGKSPYLGQYQDKAVYLLFSPSEPGFAREASGNVLTPDVLAALPAPPDGFEGARIVYGEGCTVGKERLATAGVTFKQIPYQIEGA